MPTPPRAYMICGTPRTGSTLLCGLLRSTGVAGRPESYFRRPDEPRWAQEWRVPRAPSGGYEDGGYVRAALAAGRTPNGVFGARVMWGTMAELVAKLAGLHPDLAGADLELVVHRAFGRTRFVHLRREDTVAQAVSWVRAEQTGYWQPGDAVQPGRAPRYDAHEVGATVRTIEAHNAAWQDWFAAAHVVPYTVRYEALAADIAGVTRGILDFLGLAPDPARPLIPTSSRQSDELNAEWAARFRAAEAAQARSCPATRGRPVRTGRGHTGST